MPVKSRGDASSKKSTNTNTLKANAVCILTGNVLGVLLFFAFTAIMSAIILRNSLSSSVYFPMLLAASALSGVVAGFVAVLPIRKNGLIIGLLSSIFTVIAMFISSAFASGKTPGIKAIFAAVLSMVFSATGGILAANLKKKRK